VQADVGRRFRALRRALRLRRGEGRVVMGAAGAVACVLAGGAGVAVAYGSGMGLAAVALGAGLVTGGVWLAVSRGVRGRA
jgi:hypothetical protein